MRYPLFLRMRTAVISDIHGNLEALQVVLASIDQRMHVRQQRAERRVLIFEQIDRRSVEVETALTGTFLGSGETALSVASP